MTARRHEWWASLRHDGMLVAPQLLDGLLPEPPDLDPAAYDRLRAAWLRLEGGTDGRGPDADVPRAFVAELLEGFLGLAGWQKAGAVADEFKAVAITGERLRPSWVLPDPEGGALLAVLFDDARRVGLGRGRRAHARLVELLRATGARLGLLTNGRQLRLVHAGPDYDAWAEWDAQTWFDEGEGRETLGGLAALIRADGDDPLARLRLLAGVIRESRSRQGDLAQVLGEQVRQAVELLVRDVDHALEADPQLHDALWRDPASGQPLRDEDALEAIYQAATRVVMRLVLILYAESRNLLPASVEAYHDSYGVEGLHRVLSDADRDGADAIGEKHAAWARLLALFRLIFSGSPHPDLNVRAYGGQLFRPGDAEAPEPVLRALAALEAARPSDATVQRLLRLLKVGRVKARAGRAARWVAAAVDFSDLRTEYIGIVYEGLLDYELRRAPADDPIVLLNVGRQPALPLSRLRAQSATELKELLKTFENEAKSTASAGGEEEAEDTADEQGEEATGAEPDPRTGDKAEEGEMPAEAAASEPPIEAEGPASPVEAEAASDALSEALAWAREAVESARLVRRPRGRSPDLAGYERRVAAKADGLVGDVIPPGRLYLVASGGLRKGSGSFYTRPALSVPLTQRTLEPLCYERRGDRLVPRTPEEILALKVCEPAMGSGSFLVAALRYLVDALYRALQEHGRIKPRAQRETVVTLPFGTPARGEEKEEVFDFPPEDDRFPGRLRAQLARHVVERCLYGVDVNPMAVELARLALWVETLDPELPFEYLDHKLKVGNSLVGCWLHLVEDYPVRALDREDGDGKNGVRSKWLKQQFAAAKAELPGVIDRMGGAMQLFGEVELPPEDLVARVRERFMELHEQRGDEGERERKYRELLASEEYRTLKARMDLWCALWFWPAGETAPPMPTEWGSPSEEAAAVVERLAAVHKFFHWELEFPDVFAPDRDGFDAGLGNPPWETLQPESLEFFSRHDPLYRTYSKTRALEVQQSLFEAISALEDQWTRYQATFKSLGNLTKAYADPFDVSLARGKRAAALSGGWRLLRAGRPTLAHRDHPYRLQGTGKVYTYKLFAEVVHHLLRDGGRLGMLVPSGIYTDKGTTELRKSFLERCSWEWCYGFENRARLFPIDSRFKFVPIVVERGGGTTSLRAAFMRHDVGEWERPGEYAVELQVADVRRFAPDSWSFMELRDARDQDLTDRLYAEHELLGSVAASLGGVFSQEFNVSSDDKHFVSRQVLEREGRIAKHEDARDPRVRARLLGAGYVPLYEGKSFAIHDPYFRGSKTPASVSKFVRVTTIEEVLETKARKSGTTRVPRAWTSSRLVFRNVGRSTDQRTLITCLMPPAVHGHSAATLDGLGEERASLVALLGSLAMDYVVRMKVSANLSWFYLETLPVPSWHDSQFGALASSLAKQLNALGVDFRTPAQDPLIEPSERFSARLLLDALVADLFGLHPDDLRHIATRFSIYDRDVTDDHRYPAQAVAVFEALHADGLDAARTRATDLTRARAAAGLSFGLDELWQPDGGWERANQEASEILAEAEVAA